MLIQSKAKRIIYVNTVAIKPGTNLFVEAESAFLLAAEDTINKIPTMTILDDPTTEETEVTSITGLNQKDALEIIKDVFDVVTLKSMLEDEDSLTKERPKVIKAIQKQLDMVDTSEDVEEDEE